ncbi:MAG: ribonuclease [Alphaproteobacteria bacterium]|nr:ribonuclease [Alphaproteobacteria bacterium]MBU2378967.1 ribonuclease [Alphaproteobacteria bacterium]
MSDPTPQNDEAVEADDVGERPDLGRTPDALRDALSGSGAGSDTRAGSLQGGVATGSDDDRDQASVNRTMAEQGRAQAGMQSPPETGSEVITNTGVGPRDGDEDPAEGKRDGEADAATG